MKPGRAIAINNDKNNPIRRLFDLSAPIFRARSVRLITILLDLGGRAEPNCANLLLLPPSFPPSFALAPRASNSGPREIEFIESCSSNYIFAVVISIIYRPLPVNANLLSSQFEFYSLLFSRENLISVNEKYFTAFLFRPLCVCARACLNSGL